MPQDILSATIVLSVLYSSSGNVLRLALVVVLLSDLSLNGRVLVVRV